MVSRAVAGQCGVSLIEVLVTLLILAVGLLGMAALQVRLQQAEMEAYQRSQALLLLQDMSQRLSGNHQAAARYVTGSAAPLGVGASCLANGSSRAALDLAEWCAALQGAAETLGSGAASLRVGALLGGRGCVESLGHGEYLITVAWQGLAPLVAPPHSLACAHGRYDDSAGCRDDLCRRALSTLVRVAAP